MTVKCLCDLHKQNIAFQYGNLKVPVRDIASQYGVSKRTINRVLVEQGANKLRFKKPLPKPTLPTQVQANLPFEAPQQPQPALTFMQKIKRFFNTLFFGSASSHAQTNQ
jgi:hypothetical protein